MWCAVCLPACFPPSCFSPPGPASGHHSNPGLSTDCCCCCCCIVGCCRSPQPGASDQRVRAATEMPSLSSCSFTRAMRDALPPSAFSLLTPTPTSPLTCAGHGHQHRGQGQLPGHLHPIRAHVLPFRTLRSAPYLHTWPDFFANNVHCPRPIIIPQVGQLQCLYLCSLL